ncbi:hypothetical protein CKN73_07625 [Carnobacterium divergens]|uniref:hypothetical protein n=1 Tax=Carnobacterium divergens TaxID=2748 RepID=UPI00107265D3|nr:hypothetical protein [Carnobacterium divergens]TFJ40183.1 hypothetical protein CKN77_07725 [Carnobacterium divergens]TFJ48804.1 hypothetical protein CKN73_07625 [Carnobacterium divergens]TFJ54068.1 hypothetical protein CKN83_07530 [Carnobacterium divergens]TFJ59594.1 hypothetical protein CKN89_07970 [Carnobacterium divergens]TFJ70238.1 hypothetical protein CKN91_07585 [Carnobacterium divergens]
MNLVSYLGTNTPLTLSNTGNQEVVAMIARDTLEAGVTDEMVLDYLKEETQNPELLMKQILFYDTEAEIMGGFEILREVEDQDLLKHFSTSYVYETTDFPVWEPIEDDPDLESYPQEQIVQYKQMMDEARAVNKAQQEGFLKILTTCLTETDKVELYTCDSTKAKEREKNRRLEKLATIQQNKRLLDSQEQEFLLIEKD